MFQLSGIRSKAFEGLSLRLRDLMFKFRVCLVLRFRVDQVHAQYHPAQLGDFQRRHGQKFRGLWVLGVRSGLGSEGLGFTLRPLGVRFRPMGSVTGIPQSSML